MLMVLDRPILAGIPFGAGNGGVFIYASNYLVQSYGIYAASALAGNAVLRSVLGATLPLVSFLLSIIFPNFRLTVSRPVRHCMLLWEPTGQVHFSVCSRPFAYPSLSSSTFTATRSESAQHSSELCGTIRCEEKRNRRELKISS